MYFRQSKNGQVFNLLKWWQRNQYSFNDNPATYLSMTWNILINFIFKLCSGRNSSVQKDKILPWNFSELTRDPCRINSAEKKKRCKKSKDISCEGQFLKICLNCVCSARIQQTHPTSPEHDSEGPGGFWARFHTADQCGE